MESVLDQPAFRPHKPTYPFTPEDYPFLAFARILDMSSARVTRGRGHEHRGSSLNQSLLQCLRDHQVWVL